MCVLQFDYRTSCIIALHVSKVNLKTFTAVQNAQHALITAFIITAIERFSTFLLIRADHSGIRVCPLGVKLAGPRWPYGLLYVKLMT